MKYNCTKKLFRIYKFFIIPFFIVASFFLAKDVTAISGACSSHNGVNCSIGRQLNGKVYCNDGWTDSMVDYDFMAVCKNNKPSCSIEEWNSLKNKYYIDVLYNQIQDVIEKMSSIAHDAADLSKSYDGNSFNSLQIQYNSLKSQYDSVYNQATIECSALGSIEADNGKLEQTKQDYYRAQIKANNEAIARLKEEQQKSQAEFDSKIKQIDDLIKLQNAPHYTCPSNLILSGDKCICGDGYVYNGSECITYTQNCQTKYGINSYGDKQYCHCSTGYQWNPSQTACNKIEILPIQSSPALTEPPTKIINSQPSDTASTNGVQTAKEGVKKQSPPKKDQKKATTTIVKNEMKKAVINEVTTTPPNTEIKEKNATKQEKQNFFSKALDSIKGIFSKIFK